MVLKRVLGARDATWLVAGSMIGAGIFLSPGLVAGHLPGVGLPLLAWLLGGLLALGGAMVYGELGARIPRAGGDYQYLARAYGPIWAFLTGWAAFTVTFSAAVAAMVIVALDYVRRALPILDLASAWWVRVLVVLALTWANTIGARVSGRVTALFTGLPVVLLIGLYGFGLFAGGAAAGWPAEAASGPRGPWILALGAAMIPVYFTYTGWNAAAYVAGEIREPGKNLARALVVGTALVTSLYLLINLVLLAVVPPERLAGSTVAGAEAARMMLGSGGERLLSLVISIAVLGTANVTLMGGSRIYYAMAVDGLAPRALARTNRFGVPGAALWVGGCWAAVLSAYGDVGVLVNWTSLAILLLSSLTVTSLFVLRRRDGADAPYRCPGYPVTPLVYLIASLAVACASAVSYPYEALKGFLLVAAGIPVYLYFRRRGRVDRQAPPGTAAPSA